MEPFQAEVQGIKVLQKAWHSWLTQKSGTREQEYIEYSALAWIVSPWKLEQSLVFGVWVALAPWELLRRANSMDCWSRTHRKMGLFWATLSWLHVLHSTPKIKESSGEKLCRFATTALKPFQDFSMFLKWLLDFVFSTHSIKNLWSNSCPVLFPWKIKAWVWQ